MRHNGEIEQSSLVACMTALRALINKVRLNHPIWNYLTRPKPHQIVDPFECEPDYNRVAFRVSDPQACERAGRRAYKAVFPSIRHMSNMIA